MIRVEPPEEPEDFDAKVRRPGNAWREANPSSRPKDFWSPSRPALAAAFHKLCAYSATLVPNGTIDHYRSLKNHPHFAYEWSNYRYCDGGINSKKRNLDELILDPFEIEDDWFEIILPSLQLVATDRIPDQHRERAEFTITRLGLRDSEWIVDMRQDWYEAYKGKKVEFAILEQHVPMIARAIRKQEAAQREPRGDS